MLSRKQIQKINPAPLQGVFRKTLRRDLLGQPIVDLIPVMVYDPSTRKKVQKMERGYYPNSELNKAFPEQKRNKKIQDL